MVHSLAPIACFDPKRRFERMASACSLKRLPNAEEVALAIWEPGSSFAWPTLGRAIAFYNRLKAELARVESSCASEVLRWDPSATSLSSSMEDL
jgi:hypothetical protein